MSHKRTIFVLSILLIALSALKEGGLVYPSYFPKPAYDFSKNKIDSNVIELGRAMFFDPLLSKNNSTSCASCHSPYNAFAHSDHALSHGIHDSIGTRNAPALFNLAWQSRFMWDGAINHLDMQPLAPMNHPKEMGETTQGIVKKLQQSEIYPSLFYRAFHDSAITGEKMLKAFAQFQLTLISADSKYDQVRQHKDEFTEQEKKGYQLFLKNCNACHAEPLFSTYQFANNGLPVNPKLNDAGKYAITHQPKDSLLFKIPSLRNLTYSFPYMHDGRFKTLAQVLQHYTTGIIHSPTLSTELKKSIVLSEDEKVELIAFLLTLNDKKFVIDAKHQFPKQILLSAQNN